MYINGETVTLLFYQYSIFLAIPLALVIGTFTLTVIESARKVKNQRKAKECKDCLLDSQSYFVSLSDFRSRNKDD